MNDSPEIKKQIPDIEVIQNQDFRLELNEIYFTDIDKRYDENESLSYNIYPKSNNDSWLSINTQTGTVSGKPENKDVGFINYKVRATDKYGEYIEQDLNINVINKNDSPSTTEELDNLINIQLKNEEELRPEDSKYSIYTNQTKIVDLKELVTDADILIDKSGKLRFEVYKNDTDVAKYR